MSKDPSSPDDYRGPITEEVRQLAELVANIGSEIEEQAISYLAWRQQKLTGSQNLRELADAIGVGKDTVYDRVQRFEKAFGQKIKEIGDDDQDEAVIRFRSIRDLLARFADIQDGRPGFGNRPFTINIGAGVGLCNSWVRQVVRPFLAIQEKKNHHEKDHRQIAINLVSEMPRKLREEGRKGLLDLYLTSWPNQQKRTDEVKELITLKFQLICPYGHPAVANPRDGDALNGTTVLVLAGHEDRDPLPDYPIRALKEKGAVIEEVLSYDIAYNKMRIGDSRIALIGLAEILGEEDKREFVGIRLEDLGLGHDLSVKIALVIPERARKRRNGALNALVEELAEAFKELMKTVDEPVNDDVLNAFNDSKNPWRAYHVRRIDDQNEPFWGAGQLDWRFSRDGSLRGWHAVDRREVRGNEREQQEFRVFGQMMINKNWQCHLAWQGVYDPVGTPLRSRVRETYDASFVFTQEMLLAKAESSPEHKPALVGVWHGRRTYSDAGDSDQYWPDWGYMVLCRRHLERTDENARWLYRQVEAFKNQVYKSNERSPNMDPAKDPSIPIRWEEDVPRPRA